MKYTETSLWRNSLDNQKYQNGILRKQLKDAFSRARNNASDVLIVNDIIKTTSTN